MPTQIDKYSSGLALVMNTAAGTVITTTNAGERKIFTELTITNTSTSAAVGVGIYVLDTADLPITTTDFNVYRVVQPGETWSPLQSLGGLTMGVSQSLVALPLVDSIAICSCGGYTQT